MQLPPLGSVNNSFLAAWLAEFHLPRTDIMIRSVEGIKSNETGFKYKSKSITREQVYDALEDWFAEYDIKAAVTFHVAEHMLGLIDDDHNGTVDKNEFLSHISADHNPGSEGCT